MQYINILWFLIIPDYFLFGKNKYIIFPYTSKGIKETQDPCLPG